MPIHQPLGEGVYAQITCIHAASPDFCLGTSRRLSLKQTAVLELLQGSYLAMSEALGQLSSPTTQLRVLSPFKAVASNGHRLSPSGPTLVFAGAVSACIHSATAYS